MSYLFRRSGLACGLVADLLKWRADLLIQVGVGPFWQKEEADVFSKVWAGIKIIGFEPIPHVASNAVKDGYPGEMRAKALSDTVGTREFYYSKHHVGGGSLFRAKADWEKIEVEVGTLDSELMPMENWTNKILLWLDCEGAELSVLKGGERFIERVDMVNVEMTELPPALGWCSPHDVHAWLVEKGFKRQHVHTHRLTAGQYDGIYVRRCLYDQRYSCDPF